MSTFEEEMAGFEEEWVEAQAEAGQAVMLEDGDYQARITESRVEEGEYGWQLMLKYTDLQTGRSIRSWDGFDSEVKRRITASRAKILGYEGTAAGLKEAVEGGAFIDLVCDIRVKTTEGDTKSFRNVYVNRCYGKIGDDGVPEFVPADDDGDIPF